MKKFNQKIVYGLITILLVFLPLLGALMYSLMQVVSRQNELISKDVRNLLLARDLKSQTGLEMANVPIFLITGDKSILKSIAADRKAFSVVFSKLQTLLKDPNATLMLQRVMKSEIKQYIYADTGIRMKVSGVSVEEINGYYNKLRVKQADSTLNQLNGLISYISSIYEKDVLATTKFGHKIITYLSIASGFATLLGLALTMLLLKFIRQRAAFDQANELLAQKEYQISTARRDVVGIVAHDLKSPLAAISLSSQAMQQIEKKHYSKVFNKYLNIIASTTQSMDNLITDLLDHTKIESGNLVLNKEICFIQDLVKELTERFEPIAVQKNIMLKSNISSDLGPILVDIKRIEQVFSNLLGNAIKFSRDGGYVLLSVHKTEIDLRISIKDSGPGLTRNQKEHVFERYWQVRETASQGTGLGLAISKSIIDAHNGNIWVESIQNQYAEFFFTIPK